MQRHIACRLLPALLAVIATSIMAQSAPRATPDPLDAAVSVPPIAFQSTLSTYRRYSEQPVGKWQEANETVNRTGGWRAYAREASQPDASSAPAGMPAKPSQSAPTNAPGGHAGHGTK